MTSMKFSWDKSKRQTNLKKHGLDFEDAEQVVAGHTFTRPDNRFGYGEPRFNSIGMLGLEVVVIAHTETEETIHLISMRKAERHERENCFENI